jgi:hypothetical protein
MAEQNVSSGLYGGRPSETATSGVDKMKEQMSAVAEKARDKIDSARQPIADKMHGAADTIREQAGRMPGGDTVSGAARSAAEKLESSATYLESHDAQRMIQDLLSVVKKHPTQSLLLAGVVGFLVARAFRRD